MSELARVASEAEVEVCLPGRSYPVAASDLVKKLRGAPRGMPFGAAAVACIGGLGRALLAHPNARSEPALAALGFSLRPAAIAAQQHAFEASVCAGIVRVPAGLVLHVPPANVETVFAYTWAQSVLWGNANVVRLPTRRGLITQAVLAAIDQALAAHPDISAGQAMVMYGHSLAPTAAFSLEADVRLLWGSDETVAKLRALPLAGHGREACFGSRYSLALLDAASVSDLSHASLCRLADDFAQDMYTFDQMACSSPHRLLWYGPPHRCSAAAGRFFPALQNAIAQRRVAFSPGLYLRRHAAMHRAVLDQPVARHTAYGPNLSVLHVQNHRPGSRPAPGGGLLLEGQISELEAVPPWIDRLDQTLSYFGLCDATLRALIVTLAGRGVDRVVPVGQALRMGPTWDGIDFGHLMTRQVVLVGT